MPDTSTLLIPDLAWSFAIALAWLLGEFGHRRTGLPRISIYGLVGFLLANLSRGMLPAPGSGLLLLADIAFGLILFEFGYRINLRWLRANPWLGISGLFEAGLTFVATFTLASIFGVPTLVALLLATLAMSTSPAGVLRVINEERSSGQVTERVLHLSALNSVLAVVAFKLVLGLWLFQASGQLWRTVFDTGLLLLGSALLGAAFGVLAPALLRKLGRLAQDATVLFALAVILLVTFCQASGLSPVLAALAFGLVARHRRVTLNQTQRNFGPLGELLTVLLFVVATSTLEWRQIAAGAGLGLALVVLRLLTKTAGVALLARLSGITWRKGVLAGIGLAPLSVLALTMMEQARYLGPALLDYLAPLAVMALVLEMLGPILTRQALVWARETHPQLED